MPNLSLSGIYKITNNANGKFYIGSAMNIGKRWNLHQTHLRQGRHHSRHLQSAYNIYGIAQFTITVVEEVEAAHLITREQFYIDTLRPNDGLIGYNVSPTAGSSRGIKRSLETKQRLSVVRKGMVPWNKGKTRPPFSEQWRSNMSASSIAEKNHFYGKTHSDEVKQRISAKTKARMADPSNNYFYGKRFTGESNYMFGRTHSEEARKKIGNASKGRRHSPENRKKMSEWRKGRPLLKNRKAVIQMSLDGQELARYPSVGAAAEAMGTSATNISYSATGKWKTAKGFIWKFASLPA